MISHLLLAPLVALSLAMPSEGPAEPNFLPPALMGQTRGQAARANMKPAMLAEIRSAAAQFHAKRRWSAADQDRFVVTCATRAKPELGMTPQACSCMLEVLMDSHKSLDAYSKSLADPKAKPDEKTQREVGMCVVAFGK
jgi:hypothetical protein